jgi:intracellular sulfur oxidation DsrE/DsrF family protein
MNMRRFFACVALMLATGLTWAQDKVVFTRSGVVRLAKLQGQGYAYIRP